MRLHRAISSAASDAVGVSISLGMLLRNDGVTLSVGGLVGGGGRIEHQLLGDLIAFD